MTNQSTSNRCILSLLIFFVLLMSPMFLSSGKANALIKPSRPISYIDNVSFPPGTMPALIKAMQNYLPSQYQLKKDGSSFTMSNPLHGLHVRFTPKGPQIQINNNRWGLTMNRMGYEDAVKPVRKAKLFNDNGRMVYDRGSVAEWYLNSHYGIEQGFTVYEAPEKKSGLLVVELALSGELKAELSNKSIVLTDVPGKRIARYSGLQVFDADAKSLPAHLTLLNDTLISIRVDDNKAKYPITIDPWIQQFKLTASDGASSDNFGWSISISGNTIIVGSPEDDDNGSDAGSAYVFEKPAEGWAAMTQTAKLTASDGATSDHFGRTVSISNDTIVVGAPYDDDNGLTSGSAYVFVKPASGWVDTTQTAKLTAGDGAAGDFFGNSVSVSGDVIVVGASEDDDNGGESGSAYVFEKPVSGWGDMTQTAKLTASDGDLSDHFGGSVSISGDVIAVGAGFDDDKGRDSGSAYVYVKPISGWADMTQTAKLTASDGAEYDYLGSHSISISDETVVVGATFDDDNGGNSGSAYVYVKPLAGWGDMAQTAKLTASDGDMWDQFGESVSINGNTIVIGAIGDDDKGSGSGSVYVFKKPLSGWTTMTEAAKLTATDGQMSDQFGISVATDGDVIIAGAYYDDDNGAESGSAYINFIKGTVYAFSGTNGSLDVSTPSPQTVEYYSTTQFTFNAEPGSHISSISGCGINYTNTNEGIISKTETTDTVIRDCVVTANFTINQNTIIASAGANGHLDASTPSPISLISDETAQFIFNADNGYHVASIIGCGIDFTNIDNALMSKTVVSDPFTESCTVNATFAINQYNVSASVGPYGTLDATTPSSRTVNYGETTSFTFNANPGSYVTSILGCGINYTNLDEATGTISQTTDTITSDCIVDATFAIKQNTVIASVGENGSLDGSTPSPRTVNNDETVQFTFNADTGYHVASIVGCGIDFSNTVNSLSSKTIITDPFTESCAVNATFEINQYNVSATAGANGILDVATPSPQTVNYGEITQFTFNANTGYLILSISGCGINFKNTDDTITTMPVTTDAILDNCSVEASFAKRNTTISSTITFEEFSTGLLNNGVEAGYEISTGLAYFISDGAEFCTPECPENGTQYLLTQNGNTPITIKRTNNKPFSLLSFDFAEQHIDVAYATQIDVIGTLKNGSTITETFILDGINDGSGPLDDFQKGILPDSFKNVTSVNFVWTGSPTSLRYSIDNISVQTVPQSDVLKFIVPILTATKTELEIER
ncbi:MAG: FG-GAP repeat protein [Desulfocapsaceae bacterium]|nr:FG-GAP repeat protein [Desulfocapsaceae bacterium]